MNRRQYVLGVSTVGLTAIAGCSSSGQSEQGLDTEEIKSNAEEIPYDDLLRNGDEYQGQAVHFPQAKIVQVLGSEEEGFQFRVNVNEAEYTWEDDVLIRWDGERFVTDDIVEIWGQSNGLISYEAVLGNERTIPDISAVDINLLQEG